MSRAGLALAVVGALAGACSGGASDSAGAAGERHLIYLHGRIVQMAQSARPEHPEFGVYSLDGILAAFRTRGFEVSGAIRPRGESVGDSAVRVVAEVRGLLERGVPAERITVVGASMGAGIALLASARLGEPEVRFAVLGTCLSDSVRYLAQTGVGPPAGRILAIREASDEATAGCADWSDDPELAPDLRARELELDTGLRHGFLYRPLREWLDPVLAWAVHGSGDPGDREIMEKEE